MNYQNGFIPILLVAIVVALFFGVSAYFLVNQYVVAPSNPPGTPSPNPNPPPAPVPNPPPPVACTLGARMCPDGSYVVRTGPNCEFTACPKVAPPPPPTNPNEKQVTLQEGQREGSLLVQKIYVNYITGLNFREYPVAMDQGSPITLYVGETASNGCTISLTLIAIQGNKAIFTEKTDFTKPCPICLAQDTLIDTPNGQIFVQDLTVGMPIWTVDSLGNRVASLIVKTSKTPVPPTHQMVHVVLKDGREMLASPGHPIGDGRVFSNLSAGEALDGSPVAIVEVLPYGRGYTYDILPSSSTGLYWANGILIDSTLH